MIIHKFELVPMAMQTRYFPRGIKFLTAQTQGDRISLWAEIDENEMEQDEVGFVVRPTGQIFTPFAQEKYIDTVQEAKFGLVWHVYQVIAE